MRNELQNATMTQATDGGEQQLDDALLRAASTGNADDMLKILKPFVDASDDNSAQQQPLGKAPSSSCGEPDDNSTLSAGAQPMPFRNAPLSYWCHVAAPPPGPHSPLIALRLAGTERILAIDGNGVYHSFRWQWRAEEPSDDGQEQQHRSGPAQAAAENGGSRSRANSKSSVGGGGEGDGGADNNSGKIGGDSGEDDPSEGRHQHQHQQSDLFADRGCFVAQRELAHFRSVPRLPYHPPPALQTSLKRPNSGSSSQQQQQQQQQQAVVAAISKTLFASRTLMLVVSDGDGRGGICLQLVTASGSIKTETIIPQVHSDRITAVAMDPIGNAAGQGGVGGEVTMIGSADGTATLWRFISSQFLPLRPRLRLGGHVGCPIHAVTVSGPLNLCASISSERCCLFNVSNGALVRSVVPPTDGKGDGVKVRFASCPALCLSQQGYIVVVCERVPIDGKASVSPSKKSSKASTSISIELFTLEGVHVGSRDVTDRRDKAAYGAPYKLIPIIGGKAVMACSSRGIAVHRISAIRPLEVVDEWLLETGGDGDGDGDGSGSNSSISRGGISAFDVDFGPSLVRPVVAAAACSSGALRLHALRGISQWSEENKSKGVSAAMGNALARPAARLRNVVGGVKNIGSRFMGVSKEIGKEAADEIKERGGLFGFRGRR